jgi:hypothetical protein
MELATIAMERQQAREAFLDYRRALRTTAREKLGEAEREYDAIDRAVMRGYKALAAGHQVIHLTTTLAAGGTTGVDVVANRWADGRRRLRYERTVLVPALAVVRADARQVWTRPLPRDRGFTFQANDWNWHPTKRDRVDVSENVFDRDHEYAQRSLKPPEAWIENEARLRAIVPTIPPPFRPPHKLSGYHLLFEAEWSQGMPLAPGDPALLKHLAGDLYAVLAVWDLTPLERAVLSARAE